MAGNGVGGAVRKGPIHATEWSSNPQRKWNLTSCANWGGGGLYRVEFLCQKFCPKFWFAICSVFLRICTGIRKAVLLLTCTMPKDLASYSCFPKEVPEVLKWSFLMCSITVAFNGVQTRVLADAPRNSSGK